jgi:hypothetical protein
LYAGCSPTRSYFSLLLLQVKSIENGEAQGFTPLCLNGIPDDIQNAAFIGSNAV